MTDPRSASRGLPADLAAVSAAYDLGVVHQVHYLADGVMNRNWRLDTDRGTYALKHLLDVAPDVARRNLRVLAALGDGGFPTCAPQSTAAGDLVHEVDDRAYCLLSWVDGSHLTGLTLTVSEVTALGALIARLHQGLRQATLLPPPGPVAVEVVSAEQALACADRHLAAACSGEPSDFDTAVIDLVRRRKQLIERHAADRPPGVEPVGPVGWIHGDLQHIHLARGVSGTAVSGMSAAWLAPVMTPSL